MDVSAWVCAYVLLVGGEGAAGLRLACAWLSTWRLVGRRHLQLSNLTFNTNWLY